MAANEFSNCGPALAAEDLAAVEQQFGIRFPSELRAHYLICNGGLPAKPCWPEVDDDPLCLKRFLSIRPAESTGPGMQDDNTLQATLSDVVDGQHLPSDLVPFADDWGGNYFCVSQANGAVYWFATDLGDDFVRSRRLLADSFGEFLSGLTDAED